MQNQRFCFDRDFYFRGHGTAFGHRLGSLAMVSLPIFGGLARASASGSQLEELGLHRLARFDHASSMAQGRVASSYSDRFETIVMAQLEGFRLQNNVNDYTQGEAFEYHPPLFEAGQIIGSIYSLYEGKQPEGRKQCFFLRHPNKLGFPSDIREAFILGQRIKFEFNRNLDEAGYPADLENNQNQDHVIPLANSYYKAYSLIKAISWEDEPSAVKRLKEKGYVVEFGEDCSNQFRKGDGHAVRIKHENQPVATLRFGEVLRAEESTRLVMLRFKCQYSKALLRDIQEHGQGAYDYDYSSGQGVGSDVGSNGKTL